MAAKRNKLHDKNSCRSNIAINFIHIKLPFHFHMDKTENDEHIPIKIDCNENT